MLTWESAEANKEILFMKNFVSWFDIPVKNLDRAIAFYSKVFDIKIEEMEGMEGSTQRYATFPYAQGIASGGLFEDESQISDKGVFLYLDGGEDLAVALGRVNEAGGKVLQEKTSLGEHGFMALFQDSEGNRLALHSQK